MLSIQEKRPIVSIVSNVLIFATYYYFALDYRNQSTFTSSEETQFWSAAILILVPVLILAKIVLYILFSIGNTIVTGKEEESMDRDEYGKLINSKATLNFYTVFMIGFLSIIAVVAFGFSISTMFQLILLNLFISGISLDLSEFYYFRKGI